MSSSPASDPIYKEKRKPKSPVKLALKFTDEQTEARKTIFDNDITILTGKAGCAKTTIACSVALSMYFAGSVEKIIICRPTVTASEDIGFLPGDLSEKMQPFMDPIFNAFKKLYSEDQIKKLIEDEKIQIIPFAFLRGWTLENSFVLLDEIQNSNKEQLLLALTRFGEGSKFVLCGDSGQIDLKDKTTSGLDFFWKYSKGAPGIAHVYLTENFRHPVTKIVMDIFENNS